MLKYYYTLWVDAVVYVRKKEKDDEMTFLPIVYMASVLFFNIGTVLFLLLLFEIKIELRKGLYQVFPMVGIHNKKMMITVIFFAVCAFFYFTIFREKKIEKLIEKYPYKQGKMFRTYVITSVLLFFLSLFLLYLKG